MSVKRGLLLLFGLMCSLLSALVLYISAESALHAKGSPDRTAPETMLSETEEFPMSVSGTMLQIEGVYAYDGPFSEDGSDAEVFDVAAVRVRNLGDSRIRKACILLFIEDSAYVFYCEQMPPDSSVVILEHSRRRYSSKPITGCRGWQIDEYRPELLGSAVLVTDEQLGTLAVTNLTDKTYRNLCVYYKSWLLQTNDYIGGIAYTVKVAELSPFETVYLYPFHYACGYSKIVSVTKDPL